MTIDVRYTVSASRYLIEKKLKYLGTVPFMSLDIETKGLYSKEDRKKAKDLLDTHEDLSHEQLQEYRMVAGNSGLSFPSLTKTTHFIFGTSKDFSEIIVCQDQATELMVWNWIKNADVHFFIHNALFDLKVMYHRVRAFPKNYTDTSVLAKCIINHVDVWKAKNSLKELMGSYYSPAWSVFDEYEPDNLKDKKFLNYAAIDGAATYFLHDLLQKAILDDEL